MEKKRAHFRIETRVSITVWKWKIWHNAKWMAWSLFYVQYLQLWLMFYHGQIIGRTVAAAATASMQGKPWKQFKSNLRWIHFVCSYLFSSHSPSAVPFVIRYIWIVHTSCDSKISCPFKHCATHIRYIYVVKWMFGMLNQWQLCLHAISECFYMLVGFFMLFFLLCFFISLVAFSFLHLYSFCG